MVSDLQGDNSLRQFCCHHPYSNLLTFSVCSFLNESTLMCVMSAPRCLTSCDQMCLFSLVSILIPPQKFLNRGPFTQDINLLIGACNIASRPTQTMQLAALVFPSANLILSSLYSTLSHLSRSAHTMAASSNSFTMMSSTSTPISHPTQLLKPLLCRP